MANITLRRDKNSPLTHDELDDNFENINTELTNIDVPTAVSELANDTGYITNNTTNITITDTASINTITGTGSFGINGAVRLPNGIDLDGSGVINNHAGSFQKINLVGGLETAITSGGNYTATIQNKSPTGRVLQLTHGSDTNDSSSGTVLDVGAFTGGSRTSVFSVSNTGAVTINQNYTLPITDGTVGQALVTDGAGNVSFSTVSGGGGLTEEQVQDIIANTMVAGSNITLDYDDPNGTLTISSSGGGGGGGGGGGFDGDLNGDTLTDSTGGLNIRLDPNNITDYDGYASNAIHTKIVNSLVNDAASSNRLVNNSDVTVIRASGQLNSDPSGNTDNGYAYGRFDTTVIDTQDFVVDEFYGVRHKIRHGNSVNSIGGRINNFTGYYLDIADNADSTSANQIDNLIGMRLRIRDDFDNGTLSSATVLQLDCDSMDTSGPIRSIHSRRSDAVMDHAGPITIGNYTLTNQAGSPGQVLTLDEFGQVNFQDGGGGGGGGGVDLLEIPDESLNTLPTPTSLKHGIEFPADFEPINVAYSFEHVMGSAFPWNYDGTNWEYKPGVNLAYEAHAKDRHFNESTRAEDVIFTFGRLNAGNGSTRNDFGTFGPEQLYYKNNVTNPFTSSTYSFMAQNNATIDFGAKADIQIASFEKTFTQNMYEFNQAIDEFAGVLINNAGGVRPNVSVPIVYDQFSEIIGRQMTNIQLITSNPQSFSRNGWEAFNVQNLSDYAGPKEGMSKALVEGQTWKLKITIAHPPIPSNWAALDPNQETMTINNVYPGPNTVFTTSFDGVATPLTVDVINPPSWFNTANRSIVIDRTINQTQFFVYTIEFLAQRLFIREFEQFNLS